MSPISITYTAAGFVLGMGTVAIFSGWTEPGDCKAIEVLPAPAHIQRSTFADYVEHPIYGYVPREAWLNYLAKR
jgi:hypothetical protein